MSLRIEELDYQETPLGELILRRRVDPVLEKQLTEVILNEEFLMSSLFIDGEVALSDLGLAPLLQDAKSKAAGSFSVVVGGLGLGYTAQAGLAYPEVGSMLVVDALEPVIGWHQRGLLPMGTCLSDDPRCQLVHGDFFDLALDPAKGFDPEAPARRFDAILLDIDHSPTKLLRPSNQRLYTEAGCKTLHDMLLPGGVFALWSNDAPDPDYEALLRNQFACVESHVVPFENPYIGGESINSVYVARVASSSNL